MEGPNPNEIFQSEGGSKKKHQTNQWASDSCRINQEDTYGLDNWSFDAGLD